MPVLELEGLEHWALAPDGRLLVVVPTGEPVRPPLIVLSDWRAAAGIEPDPR